MRLFAEIFGIFGVMSKKYTTNPFHAELYDIKLSKKERVIAEGDCVQVINEDTGEINVARSQYVQERDVDSDEFVKIYKKGGLFLQVLSKTAIQVLFYIFFDSSSFNSDSFLLSISDCAEHTGIKSRATIYRAMKELRDNDFIAPSSQPKRYWINPSLLYKGRNRMRYIK